MGINRRLRMELEELAQEFEKAGRSAPCAYFSALVPAHCKLGYELDCLNCPKYEPHERPGPLESAICEYEGGKVYHILQFAESNGFYRWGKTFCGRFVDEEIAAVEVSDVDTLLERRLCKKCSAKANKLSSS